MHERHIRDLQLQHDLFGFDSLLLVDLFFLDDFVGVGSSLSNVAACAAAAFLLLFYLQMMVS